MHNYEKANTYQQGNSNIFLLVTGLAVFSIFILGILIIFFPEQKASAMAVLNHVAILVVIAVIGLIIFVAIRSCRDARLRGRIKISIPSGQQVYEPGQLVDLKINFEVPQHQIIKNVTAELVCSERGHASSRANGQWHRNILYRSHLDLGGGFQVRPSTGWEKELQILIPEKVTESDRESYGLRVALTPDTGSADYYPGIEKRSKVEKEIAEGAPLVERITPDERMRGLVYWNVEVKIEPENAPVAYSAYRLRIVEPL